MARAAEIALAENVILLQREAGAGIEHSWFRERNL